MVIQEIVYLHNLNKINKEVYLNVIKLNNKSLFKISNDKIKTKLMLKHLKLDFFDLYKLSNNTKILNLIEIFMINMI